MAYETRRFNTEFTRDLQLSLSWAESTQLPTLIPMSSRFILILSSHLRLGLFPVGLPVKIWKASLPTSMLTTCPSSSSPSLKALFRLIQSMVRSPHLLLGRPGDLLPTGKLSLDILTNLSASILITCSSHSLLLLSFHSLIGRIPDYSDSLTFILYLF